MTNRIFWNKDGIRAEIASIGDISLAVLDKSDSPINKVVVLQGNLDGFIRDVLAGFNEVNTKIEEIEN